ncbi:hypothetical protein [Treponema primitia]|uniref:hypothetical protein n=1 Tax=Treponema primitia TaxID=88058 RepID=UPI00025552F4|nr:hypothetical protein [Treponema primitia]
MNKPFSRLPYMGIFLVIIVLFGGVVLFLWNWLFPAIFGLPEINYLQAVGLLALARILFGGMGLGGSHRLAGIGLAGTSSETSRGGRGHDNPFREKWMQMSEEERREFIAKRHGFHDFWGGHNGHDHDNTKKEDDTK